VNLHSIPILNVITVYEGFMFIIYQTYFHFSSVIVLQYQTVIYNKQNRENKNPTRKPNTAQLKMLQARID
jgi:hypothetical protein